MSATKTTDKSNKAQNKAQSKGQKTDKTQKSATPIEVQPKGEEVGGQAAPSANQSVAVGVQPTKRVKKNATSTQIDPLNTESGRIYLAEFYKQCADHPPRKGYDQHWNSEGFIHSGPATRLPNGGAANMVTLIGDILAKREANGDKTAGSYLDYCIEFLTTHRDALLVQRENEILAQAAAIQAKKTA